MTILKQISAWIARMSKYPEEDTEAQFKGWDLIPGETDQDLISS